MRYIVNYVCCYADEFDYTVRSIITKEQRDIILQNDELIQAVIGTKSFDIYFGSNQKFEFTIDEIIDNVIDAKELSDEEYYILIKYDTTVLNIIVRLGGIFMDRAYDLYDVENATEEQLDKMKECEDLYKKIWK